MKTLFTTLLFAASLQASTQPWMKSVQSRGEVDSNLTQSRGYARIGGFPVEIVKDGNQLPPTRLLHPDRWNPDIHPQKLKTLVIQHLHVKANSISKETVDSFIVPYVSELYFQQRHDSVTALGVKVGEAVQGTIRFAGTLRVRQVGGEILAVEPNVQTYQLSSRAEGAVANLSEYINRYDQRFLNDVAVSVLTHLFQKENFRNQLRSLTVGS